MNNSIDGVYFVEKHEERVRLIKKSDTEEVVFLDFFEFIDRLFLYFNYETISKIKDYICEHKKVIIDFGNKKAILVKDKMTNFNKIFLKEFDSKEIQNYYESVDGNMLETNYVKTILGEQKNVEPILGQ